MREIADEMKVSHSTIVRHLNKFKKMSDEEFKEILEY